MSELIATTFSCELLIKRGTCYDLICPTCPYGIGRPIEHRFRNKGMDKMCREY